MKDHSQMATGLLQSLFKDAKAAFPSLQSSLERDEQRLLSCVENRGDTVLSVDLPAFCKHFDMCLSKGQYTTCSTTLSRVVSSRHRYPRLFSGLMQLIFDDSGRVKDDIDPNAILFVRQLTLFMKKYRVEGKNPRSYKKARFYPGQFKVTKEFFDDEATLPIPSIWWDSDSGPRPGVDGSCSFTEHGHCPLLEPDTIVSGLGYPTSISVENQQSTQVDAGSRRDTAGAAKLLLTLQLVADRVSSSLGFFEAEAEVARHGPGAVSEEIQASKFEFPSWTARLDRVFPQDMFRYLNYSYWADAVRESDLRYANDTQEPKSKLICVPKDQTKPRLIASEPVANMYAQQIIRAFLARSIGRSMLGKAVTIEDQMPSRAAALAASVDGSMITLDMSNASDRLSCWVVERAFRANFTLLNALQASRTLAVVNDIDKKQPSVLSLRKFAPMGSAVTFPVQSIVYAMVAIAAILVAKDWAPTPRNIMWASRKCHVYGDDVIVPKIAGSALVELLECIWMKVNPKKTFLDGLFRESCGMDAYGGYSVTPVYVRTFPSMAAPSSIISVVETANNLWKQGFWHASKYMERTIPLKWRKAIPVVQYREGSVGLLSFCGEDLSGLRSRWNHDLQRWEYRVARVKMRATRSNPREDHSLFQWFTDRPAPDSRWVRGEVSGVRQNLTHAWTSLL